MAIPAPVMAHTDSMSAVHTTRSPFAANLAMSTGAVTSAPNGTNAQYGLGRAQDQQTSTRSRFPCVRGRVGIPCPVSVCAHLNPPSSVGCGVGTGSRRLTETSGAPRSRTFFRSPCSAAWSTTAPVMTVSPLSSSTIDRPSNQPVHARPRWPSTLTRRSRANPGPSCGLAAPPLSSSPSPACRAAPRQLLDEHGGARERDIGRRDYSVGLISRGAAGSPAHVPWRRPACGCGHPVCRRCCARGP